MKRLAMGLAAALLSAGLVGCSGWGHNDNDHHAGKMGGNEKVAVAHLHGAQGKNVTGTVRFSEKGTGPVKVVADIDGLSPGEHGIHIHESGDVSAPDLSSAKGHFNPTHMMHAGPNDKEHHAGDLGNITADSTGHAHMERTASDITVGTGQANDVVGHSVIVHGKRDDLKTQPAGDAGARVAGGTIEMGEK